MLDGQSVAVHLDESVWFLIKKHYL